MVVAETFLPWLTSECAARSTQHAYEELAYFHCNTGLLIAAVELILCLL